MCRSIDKSVNQSNQSISQPLRREFTAVSATDTVSHVPRLHGRPYSSSNAVLGLIRLK